MPAKVTVEKIADYSKDNDSDPASRFRVQRIKVGKRTLYCATSVMEDELSPMLEWPGVEVNSRGRTHSFTETGRGLAVVTAAMLGQAVLMRMQFERQFPNADIPNHQFFATARNPEAFEEGMGMELITESRGGAVMRADAETVGAQTKRVLDKLKYKATFYSRPAIVGSQRLIEE